MERKIRFTFLSSEASATATLLDDLAPKTCDAIWNALPVAGAAHHAVYSGSEGVLILPELITVPAENGTSDVQTGDIGFTWFPAGSSFAVGNAFSEICWFYDDDATPSMPEGAVNVSVFARFDPDAAAFFEATRAIRRSGVATLIVEQVDPYDPPRAVDVEHSVVYRHPHADCLDAYVREDHKGIEVTFHQRARPGGSGTWSPWEGTRLSVRSTDGGRTWSGAEPTQRLDPAPMTFVSTVALRGRRQLLVRPGHGLEGAVTLSGTTTWSERFPIRALPNDEVGTPSLLALEDGSFLAVYHVEEDVGGRVPGAVRSIHATRFRIELTEDVL